jgi:hypothetical protein
MGMLRGFWRDGQHFHTGLGCEAMSTALGYDHQHACRQLQGLHNRIDENVKAGCPFGEKIQTYYFRSASRSFLSYKHRMTMHLF